MTGKTRNIFHGAGAEMRMLQVLKREIPWAGTAELARLLRLAYDPKKPENRKKDGRFQGLPVRERERESTEGGRKQPAGYPPEKNTVRFPRLSGSEKKVRQATDREPEWYGKIRRFEGKIVSPVGREIFPEPLTEWKRLWPFLHQLYRRSKRTNRLDADVVIDHAVRQTPLSAIPWKEKKSWPRDIVLVVDFSRHLSPYFEDYRLLAASMGTWFRERLKLVVCTDSERQIYLFKGDEHKGFPLKNENLHILYAGDLGFLNGQGISMGAWLGLGRQLRRRNARIYAMLTVHPSDWDRQLSGYYNMYHWDAGVVEAGNGGEPGPGIRGAVSQKETAALLGSLAQAFELTPALVRKVRQRLGFNVSVESLALQHGALEGNGYCFQWCDSDVRQIFADRWEGSRALREDVWRIIEDFEARLPIELCIEQRQKAGRPLLPAQREFLQKLIVYTRDPGADKEEKQRLLAWIGRVAERAAGEEWLPELTNLYHCYRLAVETEGEIPKGVDLSRVPDWLEAPGPVDRVSIRLKGGHIVFSRDADDREKGGALTAVRSGGKSDVMFKTGRGGEKYALPPDGAIPIPEDTREIILETEYDRRVVAMASCPDWASGIGGDRFGLFAEVKVSGIDFVMRWIPPGEFLMGSPEDEAERFDDESPRHMVRFESGFWLAETACSQDLWQAVTGKTPSRFKEDSRNPVENVSWEDCQTFIRELNGLVPGLEIRLPSEAEWEYACRAGTETPFWFGEDLTTDKANYNGNYPYNNGPKGEFRKTTLPVKSFDPNPWGLYQMHGNVWEWCEDNWQDSYEEAPEDGSPWLDDKEEMRVFRGGSWNGGGRRLRSAYRNGGFIGGDSRGFRLARGPQEPEQAGAGGAAGQMERGTSGTAPPTAGKGEMK